MPESQMIDRPLELLSMHMTKCPLHVWFVAILAIAMIGLIDYFSGSDLRIFPLYYAPISLVAWYRGMYAAIVVSAICTLAWLTSNYLTSPDSLGLSIWAVNTFVQAFAFGIVGFLLAFLQGVTMRERELSRTDHLTSLPNRRAFYEGAAKILALCMRNRRCVTIAYVDVDNFKGVNDKFGHDAGDRILRTVADRIRTIIRTTDLPTRLGGDEFVILYPECGPEVVAATLSRLKESLKNIVSPTQEPVTISIGAVTFTTVHQDVEEMLRQADAKMYEVKKTGKNGVLYDCPVVTVSAQPS